MNDKQEVVVYESLEAFAEAVRSRLEEAEASNSFILGRIESLLAVEEPEIGLMVQVHEGGDTKLAAMCLGDGIALSRGDSFAAAKIADEVSRRGLPTERAFGPNEVVQSFSERYAELCECAWSPFMSQRVYQTDTILHPNNVPGFMRVGCESDLQVLVAWMIAFVQDANLGFEMSEESARENIVPKFALGRIFVWEHDGRPVAMASTSRPTKTTMTVNAVYTPPQERNRGHASALVAAVSEHILRSGKRYSVLLTDLTNPTSNSIYMKIGYVPVSDSVSIKFAPK